MALLQDFLAGLTPDNGRNFDDLNEMLERLKATKVADAGEDKTPGFGMTVKDMPPEPQRRLPHAQAPSTSGWKAGLEPSQRLEQTSTPQNMTVPQTAPVTQTQKTPGMPAGPSQAAPRAPAAPGGGVPPVRSPDFWDRLGAFSRGYNTGGLVGAVADGFGSGLDRQVEAQNQTAQALVKMGVAPELVTAATRNPDIMKALVTSAFNKQMQPVDWKIDDIYDEKTGRKRRVMYNPRDPRQMFPIGGEAVGREQGLNPTEQKTLNKAEDDLPNLDGTVEALDRALELNEKTFTGYTSGMRGWLGTAAPKDSWMSEAIDDWGGLDRSTSEATREWKSIMSPEAIKAMSATLTGATTNFELQKFEEVLSDPDAPPEQRRKTIERMLTLAKRQRETAQRRIEEMRGGGVKIDQSRPAPAPTPDASAAPNLRGVPKEPPANARRGKDGSIYIPDPSNPGKYLRWVDE
jgi:hypothetical protein